MTNSIQELRTLDDDNWKVGSEKCRAIVCKLAAKIEGALEEVGTVFNYREFRSFKSQIDTWLNNNVTNVKAIDLEDCPTAVAIQAQERRTRLRQVFAKIGSSCKSLLHARASQSASPELRIFVHEAGTEATRTVWRRGTRAIRSIVDGRLPSSVPDIVSILQVANAMRSALPPSGLVCSKEE